MDLLIASMSLVRIAVLDPKFCVPVVGARDDGQKGITTPLERKPMDINAVQDNNLRKVYGSLDSNLVVIQQRSPVLKVRLTIQVFLRSPSSTRSLLAVSKGGIHS